MYKLFLLLLEVVLLSKSDGILMPRNVNPSFSPDESDGDNGFEEWDPVVPYPVGEDGSKLQIVQKRSNADMSRRSTLDKNFMRFGRSGYFPEVRCCKHRDLIGLAGGLPEEIEFSKRNSDGNFMRFGRAGNENFMRFGKADDNFMRFGKGGENFMRFGKADDNFMRFGKGGENFMRFGKADDNFMRFGKGGENFMRFGKADDNFMRFGKGGENFMRFGKADDNFMRFGRGKDDNFIRFGKADETYRRARDLTGYETGEGDFGQKEENFKKFGKNWKSQSNNFVRFGKSNGKDENFIRFGKNDHNGTHFEEAEEEDGIKIRRRRMAPGQEDRKSSVIEGNLNIPAILKFISLINGNHPSTTAHFRSEDPAGSSFGTLG